MTAAALLPPDGPLPDGMQPWEGVSQRQTRLRAAATAAEAARPPVRGPHRWFGRLVADIVRKADRDRMLGLAAETAFFAVLTLFPSLLAATAVLGQLGAIVGRGTAARVEGEVLDFLDRLLTASGDGVVDTVRELFEGSGNALTLATLLALVSVSTVFATVINTVTITHDVPETRGWWRRRWLGLLLGTGTVITGAFAVTLLVVGPLFGRGLEVVDGVGLDDTYAVLWDYTRAPVAFLSLVLWATTMYHLTPPERSTWRGNLPGGLLAALLWLGASVGLNIYLQVVVVRNPILGALGGGLILMTWFYLLCAGLLIGGELNAVLRARRKQRRLEAMDRARDRAQDRAQDAPELATGDGAAPGPAPQPQPQTQPQPQRQDAAARTAMLRSETG